MFTNKKKIYIKAIFDHTAVVKSCSFLLFLVFRTTSHFSVFNKIKTIITFKAIVFTKALAHSKLKNQTHLEASGRMCGVKPHTVFILAAVVGWEN